MNLQKKTLHQVDNVSYCGKWIIIFVLALTFQSAVGDLFTSVHEVDALILQEHRLLDILQDYISTQQEEIKLLEKQLEKLMKVRPPGQTVQELIHDPITAFSLVRRLARQWPDVLHSMTRKPDLGEDVMKELSQLPKEEYFENVKRGLTKLQDAYKLDTKQLAHEFEAHNFVTAFDLFEMGNHFLKNGKYEVAASWFREALEKNTNRKTKVWEDKIQSRYFLAKHLSGCKNGTATEDSLKALQNFISKHPNYTLDKESWALFREALSTDCPRQKATVNLKAQIKT